MGILFLPARQERCSSLLSYSAVRPLPLLRLRPRLTPTLVTATPESMEDMATVLDTAVATPPLDTPDLDTAVDTTEDSATAVATMESVRLRLSLRLIPTTVTVTLASTVDTV